MDWLQSLLWDPSSVAHIVFLYAFVVAAGVYLGKIKIFGVSLGVTFVLSLLRYGAGDGIRTRDICLGKATLYH